MKGSRSAVEMRKAGRWRWIALLGVVALAGSIPARASILLSDDFESGFISGAIWATNGSGQLVADPESSGHGFVLHFTAQGSGGDLYSHFLSDIYPVALDFDFLQVGTNNSGAYVGTDHVTSGFTPTEQWILNTGGGGAYPNLNFLSGDTWHHVSLTFNVNDPFSIGTFALKLEQNSPGSNAYFDNIVIAANPEPATWLGMVAGLGVLATKLRRRTQKK